MRFDFLVDFFQKSTFFINFSIDGFFVDFSDSKKDRFDESSFQNSFLSILADFGRFGRFWPILVDFSKFGFWPIF